MKGLIVCISMFTFGAPALAEGEPAGEFDYFVMALSWSPSWCDGRETGPQCGRSLGWILHGLWPQYETGWPSYCRTSQREATRGETGAMVDIMGSSGNAWYQWKKHGRCSGESAAEFFGMSRKAYGSVVRPEVFRSLERDVRLPASVVEEAFLQANPALKADMITVTCKNNEIQEVRICLTRDLEPRICGADVIRDCEASSAFFPAMR